MEERLSFAEWNFCASSLQCLLLKGYKSKQFCPQKGKLVLEPGIPEDALWISLAKSLNGFHCIASGKHRFLLTTQQ